MHRSESSLEWARWTRLSLLLLCGLVFTACGWNNKARGTAVGTTAGAAVGAVVGNQVGSTARGAIIGAVVGGATGAIIGSRMDRQAADIEREIPGAVVTRVGEGLIVTFASGILYDTDSDVIRAEAGRNLGILATSLKEYAGSEVLIVGHTDSRGETAYNDDLSLRRARAAARFLGTQGVTASRVRIEGRGEMEPIASNESEAGRQANRRIEVAIYETTSTGREGG